MKKIWTWLLTSNRYLHILAGFLIGALCTTVWDAAVAVCAAAFTAEYKDMAWGGKWDWTDLACTIAGGAVGFFLHTIII